MNQESINSKPAFPSDDRYLSLLFGSVMESTRIPEESLEMEMSAREVMKQEQNQRIKKECIQTLMNEG